MKTKITHLTSAHPRYDTRIFVKICSSLAKVENYEVNLVVADSLGDEFKNGIHIYDVGKLSGRINRMFKTTQNVFQKAKELNSDIYHFHDPELIPIALKLKKLGKKVIFDIHEDVPNQILAKPYLNKFSKYILSKVYAIFEDVTAKRFDFLVTPTSYINERFIKINPNSVEIRNYPILDELINDTPWNQRDRSVCHIGSLAQTRGVLEIVKAVGLSEVKLELAGNFRPLSLENDVKALDGYKYVNFHGFIDRIQVQNILANTKIGLVTLHPTDSYLDAVPVKMFEYMVSSIPVIASDFPFYRELLAGCDCVLFVDPLNPNEIADAITTLLNDDTLAKKMGENGKKSVLQEFNWDIEEKKLYRIYESLV